MYGSFLAGTRKEASKAPICGVSLIPRPCGVRTKVRLSPRDSGALHLGIFDKPENVIRWFAFL